MIVGFPQHSLFSAFVVVLGALKWQLADADVIQWCDIMTWDGFRDIEWGKNDDDYPGSTG
ncbi:MAG: hypothetical protein U0350_31665 [Caldilineaceae bacterium]